MTNWDQLDIWGDAHRVIDVDGALAHDPQACHSCLQLRDAPGLALRDKALLAQPFHSTTNATINKPMLVSGTALALPLASGSVDCVVTSPPYWGLRTYGDDPDEIGSNQTMDDYIASLVSVAREVGRVLKDDGLFWLNLGDTAAGSGGAGGDYNKGGSKNGKQKWKQGSTSLSPMQWCSVPHRVVHALQDEGWLLRSDICWNKGQVRPEDVRHVRRPLIGKEPIFMLAKHRDHRFFHEGLVELGNVWTFPPARGKNHSAPFPDELPRRCILVSTLPGDVVLDPFAGSNTTANVACALGRVGIGIDLYAGRSPEDDAA